MARKRRSEGGKPAGLATSASTAAGKPGRSQQAGIDASRPARASRSASSIQRANHEPVAAGPIPAEIERGDWTAFILAAMMFLAPALGVPHEEMLQDTLKSMVAAFSVVIAGLLFFWRLRQLEGGLRWHALMWLPLALTAYALGSMMWSHTFLAGVEAIRWFLFSLMLFLALNTLSRARLPYVMEGIHWGAVVASLWTALQFWFDFRLFPQGPNPASTFVNRNFFAEFVVCTIPFSAYLLVQSRSSPRIALMAATLGLNVVALMMTGTRGALTAFWITAFLVFPLIAVLYRQRFAAVAWSFNQRVLACGVLSAAVLGLGLIGTGNEKLIADGNGYSTHAFGRALTRTASISPNDGSLQIRVVMWKATGGIIKAHPLAGIGAGAWEAMLPLYQAEGSQLETDYYVHNEVLQLLAEYGLTGLLFLLGLFSYLLHAAWATLRNRTAEGAAEAPLRAIALSSLLALMVVSNIGFPWRLASTGCLFALCLGMLAASDARLQKQGIFHAARLAWKPLYSKGLVGLMVLCLALTVYISQQAAAAEQKIVLAVKMTLGISHSGDHNDPRWDARKKEMLRLLAEGIAINPHYRKITPMVADEMARWGDWKNAVWIWESVISSRPYVVAILANIARGYAQMGRFEQALHYLERGEKLQPRAPAVLSLKVILLSRMGREPEARRLARQYMQDGTYDSDLLNSAYVLAMRANDFDMAINSLELRQQSFPSLNVDSLLKLGAIFANHKQNRDRALAAYRAAIALSAGAPPAEQAAIRRQIPDTYLSQL